MKYLKRTVSVALAFLMLFSSMSVLASAVIGDGNRNTVAFDTKFYRKSGTEWVETTKAARGEQLKVRITMNTDFVCGSSTIFWLFSKNNLILDTSGYTVGGATGSYNVTSNISCKGDFVTYTEATNYAKVLMEKGFLPEDTFENYGYIYLTLFTGEATKISADDWTFEYDFTVADDASGIAQMFFPVSCLVTPEEDTWDNPSVFALCDDSNEGGAMDNSVCECFDCDMDIVNLDQDEDSTLTFTNAVKFDAGKGTFANGTSTYTTSEGFIGEALSASDKPANPTLSGSSFVGWLPSSVDAATATSADCVSLDSIKYNYTVDTYTALYETSATPDPEVYTFSFDANGGTFADSTTTATVTVNEGEAVTVTAPTKVGHNFKGWALATVENPTADDVTALPAQAAASASYKAVWEKASYTVSWVVDGNVEKTEQVAYGDAIPAAPALTKEGNDLSWSIAPATMPAEALTIVGTWTPKTYEVIWKVDGEEVGRTTETYGKPLTPPEFTVPGGKTFAGWTDKPEVMPANENLIVNGTYSTDKVTITYYLDDAKTKVYFTETVDYGSPTPKPEENPSINGKTFMDWAEVIPANLTENLQISAMFSPKDYEISFKNIEGTDINGKPYPVHYEDQIVAPEDEDCELEGYTFLGTWKYNGETITFPTTVKEIVNDVDETTEFEFIGDYEKNKYTLSFYLDEDAKTPFFENEYEFDTLLSDIEDLPTDEAVQAMKPGYTFDGWDVDLTEQMDDDYSYTGQWSPNSYSVSFTGPDGEVIHTADFAYNADIAIDFSTDVTGYTFNDKWTYNGTEVTFPISLETLLEGAEPGEITFAGDYTIEQYTVAFYADVTSYNNGTAVSSMKYNYGTSYADVEVPTVTKLGHTFKGWDTDPATLDKVTGEMSFIAEWNDKEYNVTFTTPVASEGWSLYQLCYESELGAFDANIAHYTFNKWTYNGTEITLPTTVADIIGENDDELNIVITGDYTPNKYTVAFYLDEESKVAGNAISSTEYTYGTPYTDVVVPAPTKLGSTFDGWNPDLADFDTVDESRDFVGTWIPKTYNVTFKGPNGETVTTGAYGYNDVIGDLGDEINVEGFSFDGKWTYNGTEITSANTIADIIGQNDDTLNIELVGSYTENAKPTYTVKFVDENGGELSSASYQYNDDITAPAYTAPTGMTFNGWVNAADNTAYTGKAPASSVTYKPDLEWIDYTITFVDEDGDELSSATYHYNDDITAPDSSAVTAPEGMVFTGWADADGNAFTGKAPAASATYHPVFGNSNSVAYSIEVYLQNTAGKYELSASTALTGTNGQTVTAQAGTVTGFTLNESDSVLSATVKGDGSTKLIVKYSRNTYKATFGSDVRNVMYGAALPEVTPDAITGKEFKGWVDADGNAAPATMPAENLTLTAKYEDINYTITYIVNGKATVQTYKYNETVVALADPVVDGMTFIKWIGEESIPTKMPARDLIFEAEFEVTGVTDTYTVRFWANDSVYDSRLVKVGASIALPTGTPTKENYVFKGWKNVPVEMPDRDVEIYADFERIPVVLVPKDSTVTTVIDRDNMLIYGLKERITEAEYADYLAVEGDGHFEVIASAHGYGTGTEIKLYDNVTNECIETYHVVIFGDINGDAFVNAIDVSMATDETASVTKWSVKQEYSAGALVDNSDYVNYMAMAADLNKDGMVDSIDIYLINSRALLATTIDQTTGTVVE